MRRYLGSTQSRARHVVAVHLMLAGAIAFIMGWPREAVGNRVRSEAPESPGVSPSRLFFISLSFMVFCCKVQLTPGLPQVGWRD